jgi:hypothetical protein
LVYNITDNTATGFPFGDCYYVLYDPFRILYFEQETVSSLEALQEVLDTAEQSNLFIVPMSHYPIMCNGETSRCQAQNFLLRDYFTAMENAGVSLYFGAHAHEYNRIYPYYAHNQSFVKLESPYRDDQGYMVSIVEGVGGSNTDLVLEMPVVYNFTASYTANQTGFGILTTNANNEIAFDHYSTKNGLFDSIVIKKVKARGRAKEAKEKRGNL